MKMVSSSWNEQRIQIPGRMTFLPYYTSSPWGKNEAYFIFYSALPDFSRVWLHTWSPDEGRITAEFELTAWNGLDGLLVSELLLSAVLLPEQRQLLLPLREKLYSVSVDDGSAEMVWALPDASLRLGGPGNPFEGRRIRRLRRVPAAAGRAAKRSAHSTRHRHIQTGRKL